MEEHGTYQSVFTADDVDESDRRTIESRVESLYDDAVDVRFEPSSEGPLELVLPDRIPATMKDAVRAVLAEELPYSPGRHERLLLELHVNWPTTRYRVCIGFE